MKRLAFIALLIGAFSLSVFAKGKQPIAFANLPENVQEEVKKHFTEDQIQFITAKKGMGKKFTYTFTCIDNTKFIYDHKAQLRYIAEELGVEVQFLPESIWEYVNTTMPNAIITSYKRETGCQKVELNDKMTLVFNPKGKFIRIDD